MIETRATHKFLDRRSVVIGLPISDELATDFLDAIEILKTRGSAPVTVYINSPGGAALASESIIDAIGNAPFDVDTFCIGLAAGTAVFILAAGKKRFITSESIISFLEFSADDQVGGRAIENVRNRMLWRAAQSVGVPLGTIDHWLATSARPSAAELIQHGFISAIVSRRA